MPRSYGITNTAPYASAPAVGASGDTYWNTTSKIFYISDGTNWVASAGGGGGGGGAPSWVGTITSPTVAGSPYTLTHNLNTTTPFVQMWDAVTLSQILGQVTVLNANQIQVSFSSQPANNVTVVVGGISTSTVASPVGPWTGTITTPAALTNYTLTHNLGTNTPIVQMYDAVTLTQIVGQITVVNANSINASFTQAPPNNVTVVISTGGSPPAGAAPTGPWSGSIVSPAANTTYTLSHNLNTTAPLVQLWDSVTHLLIQGQVAAVNNNQVAVLFSQAPPNNVTVVVSSGGGTPGPTASNVYYLTYYQTVPAVQAGSPYVVNHRLNSTQVIVQLWDAVTTQLVEAQVQIVDSNNIRISVAQSMPNNVNVVVMIGPSTPAAVQPGDMTSKAYVDARTPNLPAVVTSGSTVQTYTDPTGEVWIAKNGVKGGNWYRARDVIRSRVYRNATWTANASSTLFVFDSMTKDDYTFYNLTSGIFTCPVAGWYHAMSQIGVQYSTASLAVGAAIVLQQNGVGYSQTNDIRTTTVNGILSYYSNDYIYCAANDQLALWFNTANAPSATRVGSNLTYAGFYYEGSG